MRRFIVAYREHPDNMEIHTRSVNAHDKDSAERMCQETYGNLAIHITDCVDVTTIGTPNKSWWGVWVAEMKRQRDRRHEAEQTDE